MSFLAFARAHGLAIDDLHPSERIRRCPLDLASHRAKLCPLHRRLDDSIAMIEREFARTSLAEVIETSVKSSDSCPSLVGLTVRAKPVARGKKA